MFIQTKDDSEDTWSRGEYKGHQKRKVYLNHVNSLNNFNYIKCL